MARTTRWRRTEGVAHAWRKVAMPHLATVGEGLGLPELDSPLPPTSPLSPAQQAIAKRFRAAKQIGQTVHGFALQEHAVVSGAPSRATPRSSNISQTHSAMHNAMQGTKGSASPQTEVGGWEAQFAWLAAYKEAHGNCNVPLQD